MLSEHTKQAAAAAFFQVNAKQATCFSNVAKNASHETCKLVMHSLLTTHAGSSWKSNMI